MQWVLWNAHDTGNGSSGGEGGGGGTTFGGKSIAKMNQHGCMMDRMRIPQ